MDVLVARQWIRLPAAPESCKYVLQSIQWKGIYGAVFVPILLINAVSYSQNPISIASFQPPDYIQSPYASAANASGFLLTSLSRMARMLLHFDSYICVPSHSRSRLVVFEELGITVLGSSSSGEL